MTGRVPQYKRRAATHYCKPSPQLRCYPNYQLNDELLGDNSNEFHARSVERFTAILCAEPRMSLRHMISLF